MIGYPAHHAVAATLGLKFTQLMVPPNASTYWDDLYHFDLGEVVHHETFFYNLTRYPLLSQEHKGYMLRNAHRAMFHPMSSGLVEHTSSPFPKELLPNLLPIVQTGMDNAKRALSPFYKDRFNAPIKEIVWIYRTLLEKVEHEANGKMADTLSNFLREYYCYAADLFYTDYKNNYPFHPTARVLLENNVQLPIRSTNPYAAGRVAFLSGLALRHPELYSICLDEEHAYATGDYTVINYQDFTFNLKFVTDVPFSLYHFNTVPISVEMGSFKDKHSSTTLKESKVPYEKYALLIKELDAKGVRAIREINSATQEREFGFIQELTDPYR